MIKRDISREILDTGRLVLNGSTVLRLHFHDKSIADFVGNKKGKESWVLERRQCNLRKQHFNMVKITVSI
jgi:hypothetical protein